MRSETLAVHGGSDGDPLTRACAVPMYQTVADGFEPADHAAALFDLTVPRYRYSCTTNPTIDVLERRVAAMKGMTAQQAASVTPDLIRISIGIEHVDDIIEDLDHALGASRRQCITPAVAAHS